MFGLEKLEPLIDEIKSKLPAIQQSIPEWVKRVESLEAKMISIGEENNRLLALILEKIGDKNGG
jgi:hypothetical protein